MSRLTIEVNGEKHAVVATANTPLLYVLRNELRLHGPRFGCGLAQCGACTVHLGGQAIRSCVTPVAAATDKPITTLGGSRHAREASSAADGVHRGSGRAVRLLHERDDHGGIVLHEPGRDQGDH